MGRRSDLDRPLTGRDHPGNGNGNGPGRSDRVDRVALLARHRVRLGAIEPAAPLQVGNGAFAVAVDVTGLQTFAERYPVAPRGTLLGSYAEWAWHSSPGERFDLDGSYRIYDTPAGPVPYLDLASEVHDGPDQSRAETWLRANPHRFDLGRVGLWTGTVDLHPDQVRDIDQELDLATGTIRSRFRIDGVAFTVTTAVHPDLDAVGVSITTDPAARCGIRLRFPYPGDTWGDGADWDRPEAHDTTVRGERGHWTIERAIDHDLRHWLAVAASDPDRDEPPTLGVLGRHDLVVEATGGLEVTVAWSTDPPGPMPPPAREVHREAAGHWAGFWSDGAAVELAGSDDPRAVELERRVVLSRYLTALNSTGSIPPTETGLLVNSWWGRFHLEMHWFHSAQFALWGNPGVVDRQLAWFERIRPLAVATARRQGLPGVRWPKQVDPTGRETPSSIGPFLVWQQPQPIYLAELVRRAAPAEGRAEVRDRWLDLVVDTADFMAAFATPGPGGYGLGPPIVPAQESYHRTRATARNPTFELALWAWTLDVAVAWCESAGRPVPERWRAVAAGMAPPHRHGAGYAALATPPHLLRDDHPSMLAAYGLVPPTPIIDPTVMVATFDDVLADWDRASMWGWDQPVAALCAARLGRPDDAVAALLADSPKNRYLVNGHNRQSAELPAYLPGNGSLLAAVALMAAGWDGAPAPTPGFGAGWRVAVDGVLPLP